MLTYSSRITYLSRWEGEPEGDPWMRFRLIYDGELKSSQRDPQCGQADKLAEHKQEIRKVFHRQLRYLWENDWFLRSHRVNPRNYGINRPAADIGAQWADSPDNEIPLVEAVAYNHREHGYRFVPLVQKDWRLLCSLDILFLRHDPPGSAIHAGDLDNRVKTIIDGLRKPGNLAELRGNETPAADEDPFFCLLEDDKLVTGLTIETDRLLEPPAGRSHYDKRQVRLVISVDIRPYDVTSFNLSFA
jgi:hypothetical protein